MLLKGKFGYDDSLDAFGVHGVGGYLGAILTGVFAFAAFGGTKGAFEGHVAQVWYQFVAATCAGLFSGIGTLVLVVIIDRTMGFRISRSDEIEGLDAAVHGEQGWMLEQVPSPSVAIPGTQTVEPVAARKRTNAPVH